MLLGIHLRNINQKRMTYDTLLHPFAFAGKKGLDLIQFPLQPKFLPNLQYNYNPIIPFLIPCIHLLLAQSLMSTFCTLPSFSYFYYETIIIPFFFQFQTKILLQRIPLLSSSRPDRTGNFLHKLSSLVSRPQSHLHPGLKLPTLGFPLLILDDFNLDVIITILYVFFFFIVDLVNFAFIILVKRGMARFQFHI